MTEAAAPGYGQQLIFDIQSAMWYSIFVCANIAFTNGG